MKGVLAQRYVLGDLLGAGGVAEVYAAHDRSTNTNVAVKVLLAQHADVPLVRKRFLQEAALTKDLRHPNILPVTDAGESAGVPFLAMPLAQGSDLGRFLDGCSEPLAPPSVRHLALALARALKATHERGIIHQDLKPSNVLLMAEAPDDFTSAQIVLADFGQARAMLMASMTGSSLVWGSPQYMAPEAFAQGRGDPRSDLFSLGVILFEALTLRTPWKPGAPLARLLDQTTAPATASGDDDLDDLVAALLSTDPNRRPATAAHVVAILENATALSPAYKTIACSRCGLLRPSDIHMCLSCEHTDVTSTDTTAGPWHVLLRRMPANSQGMERLHDLLRATTGIPNVTLSLRFGMKEVDGPYIGPWTTALPARLFGDLDEATAVSLTSRFCAAGIDVVAAKGWTGRARHAVRGSLTFVGASLLSTVMLGQVHNSMISLLVFGAFAGGAIYEHRKLSKTLFQLRPATHLVPEAHQLLASLRRLQTLGLSAQVQQLLLQLSANVYRLAVAWSNGAPASAWEALTKLVESIADASQRLLTIEQSLARQSEGEIVRSLVQLERKAENAPPQARQHILATISGLQDALTQRQRLNDRRDTLVSELCLLVSHVEGLSETAPNGEEWSVNLINAHEKALGSKPKSLPPSAPEISADTNV